MEMSDLANFLFERTRNPHDIEVAGRQRDSIIGECASHFFGDNSGKVRSQIRKWWERNRRGFKSHYMQLLGGEIDTSRKFGWDLPTSAFVDVVVANATTTGRLSFSNKDIVLFSTLFQTLGIVNSKINRMKFCNKWKTNNDSIRDKVEERLRYVEPQNCNNELPNKDCTEQTDCMMELSNPEHESSLVDTLGLYLAREEYLDLTFLCKDARKVRAHKLVFTSVSPFMKELISNWDGPQDDVIISMAEVSYKTMKLITSFLYDGMMKLGKEELIEFRDVLNMLDIVMPDAVMSPVLSFSAAYPLPPVRRLDKSQRINLDKAHKAREVFNPQIIDTRTLCSKVFNQNVEEELPATTNGDDDPLDVPDFYFVPQQSASTSNQADNVLAKEPTTSAAVLNQPREQAAAMDKSIASRHTRQMVKKGNRQAIPKPKEKGVPNKVVTKSTPLQEQLKIQNQAYLYAPFDVEGLTGLPPLQPTTNDNCMQNSEVPPAAAETLESGSKKRKDTSTAKRSHKKKRKQDLLKTGIQRTF